MGRGSREAGAVLPMVSGRLPAPDTATRAVWDKRALDTLGWGWSMHDIDGETARYLVVCTLSPALSSHPRRGRGFLGARFHASPEEALTEVAGCVHAYDRFDHLVDLGAPDDVPRVFERASIEVLFTPGVAVTPEKRVLIRRAQRVARSHAAILLPDAAAGRYLLVTRVARHELTSKGTWMENAVVARYARTSGTVRAAVQDLIAESAQLVSLYDLGSGPDPQPLPVSIVAELKIGTELYRGYA